MNIVNFVLGVNLWNSIKNKSFSYPQFSDFSGVITFCFFWLILEIITSRFFRKIGRYLLLRNKGPEFLAQYPFRLDNFSHRGFVLTGHIILSILAIVLFRNEEWWFFSNHILGSTFPYHRNIKWTILLYYNLNTADYLYKTIVLCIRAVLYGKRRDFWEMIYHHVLSFALQVYSLLANYSEFGILFLFISNLTDIVTYSARMVNDVKWKWPSLVLLPTLILAWVVNRLFINPVFLIAPGFIGYNYANSLFCWRKNGCMHTIHAFILIKLLCGLYILHVYWIYGLSRIAYNTVVDGFSSTKLDEKSLPTEKKDGVEEVDPNDLKKENVSKV